MIIPVSRWKSHDILDNQWASLQATSSDNKAVSECNLIHLYWFEPEAGIDRFYTVMHSDTSSQGDETIWCSRWMTVSSPCSSTCSFPVERDASIRSSCSESFIFPDFWQPLDAPKGLLRLRMRCDTCSLFDRPDLCFAVKCPARWLESLGETRHGHKHTRSINTPQCHSSPTRKSTLYDR